MDYLRISEEDYNGIIKVWFNLDAKHETFISAKEDSTIGDILDTMDLYRNLYITGGLKDLWHDVDSKEVI